MTIQIVMDIKMQFMYDTFEEYAEIMGIKPDHPNWEAYKIIWNMARLQMPKDNYCGAV